MKRIRSLLYVALLCGLSLGIAAQVPPPDTGKLSWGLFEMVSSQITKSTVGEAALLTALLTAREPVRECDLATLRELGYQVLGSFARLIEVEAPARLYIDSQKGLATLDFVLSADFPPTAQTNDTPIPMESIPVIGADQAWDLGYEGQGAKIAVIEWGYANHADLEALDPVSYVVSPGSGIGTYEFEEGRAGYSPHGTSCALIAGTVAPEAELYLLSFPSNGSNQLDFMGWLACLAFAVEELAVDVVTTQIWFDYPTCHADGTGVLVEAVDEILGGTDTMLVIAAGNWAEGVGSGRAFYAGTFGDSDNDQRHDFDPAVTDPLDENDLRFDGHAGDTILLMLEWDDWESEVKSADLDLLLYYAAHDKLPVRVSRTRQFGRTTSPYEKLEVTLPYDGEYAIVLEDRAAKWHEHSSTGVHFHLYLLNGSAAFTALEHHSAAGSIREIATSRNPQVISVGAVDVDDPASVRPYSSRGPTWDGRCKPDLYAPDGISGTMYPSFGGTSAAAPHIAGAIALLRSVDPDLAPAEILAALRASAGCLMPDGCGCEGHAVELAAAIQHVLTD